MAGSLGINGAIVIHMNGFNAIGAVSFLCWIASGLHFAGTVMA
jgi:hypothetical protein